MCDTSNHTSERRIVVSVWTQESPKKQGRQRSRCVTISSNHSAKKRFQNIPTMGASQELEGCQPKDANAN